VLILLSTFWMGVTLTDTNTDNQLQIIPPSAVDLDLAVSSPMITKHTTNTTMMHSQYLWHQPQFPRIPEWMKEYLDWHTQTVATLHQGNWDRYNYIVLRCYRVDERCGGVSDRLKPVPLILLAAARSRRVFFIHWDRPCRLEEFLVPPHTQRAPFSLFNTIIGVQWSVPDFMEPILQTHPHLLLTRAKNLLNRTSESTAPTFVHTHIHDVLGGSTQYDEQFGQGAFGKVYHDLFRILFAPSPGVQRLIDSKMLFLGRTGTTAAAAADPNTKTTTSTSRTTLSNSTPPTPLLPQLLVPGTYAVAHYRAEYGREVRKHPKLTEPGFLRQVALNAIRCASQLRTHNRTPIYFASDNPMAMETVRLLALEKQYPLITFDRDEAVPLKLDDYNTTTTTKPSDYYSTFVDLLLAGNGNCVAYGRGGFGRFASLLSFNASCSIKHVKSFFPVICQGEPPFVKEV
jgi:hypothetical protein